MKVTFTNFFCKFLYIHLINIFILYKVISVLLEKYGLSKLAEKMIFIAGHKVTSDPVCIPFSMGRNLICIHSKKHIKNPPEDIPRKQAQNLESMKVSIFCF
jgi:glycerol-3-phosphate O-acyltransferase